MPIQTPPRILSIKASRRPHSPALLEDVKNAIDYGDAVRAGLGGPLDARTTLEDFTLARIYEYRVIQSHIQQDQNALLRGLEQMNAQLTRIETQMDTRFGQIEEQIKVMKDHLVAMDERSIEASILSAQAFNSSCHDGTLCEFQVVRLPNGERPESKNLPVLRTILDIKKLSLGIAKRYCEAYGLAGDFTTMKDYQRAIGRHIGCLPILQ